MDTEKIVEYQEHLKKKQLISEDDDSFENVIYNYLYNKKVKVICDLPYQTLVIQKNQYHPFYVEHYANIHKSKPIAVNQLSGNAYLIKGPFYGPQIVIYIGSIWTDKLQVFYVPSLKAVYCHAWKMDFIELQRLKPLGLLDRINITDTKTYEKYKLDYEAVESDLINLPITVKCQDDKIELPRKTFAIDSVYLQKIMNIENFIKPEFLSFTEFTKDTILNYYYGKPYVIGSNVVPVNIDAYLATLEFCVFVMDYEAVNHWHLAILNLMHKIQVDAQTETQIIDMYQKLLPNMF